MATSYGCTCPGLCLHPPGQCHHSPATATAPPVPSSSSTGRQHATEEQAKAILYAAVDEGSGVSVRGSLRTFLQERKGRRSQGGAADPRDGVPHQQQRLLELRFL